MLLLGRSRLALGEPEKALDAFRRLRAIATLPAQQLEGRFWEAESLYRLKQFAAARAAYDDVLSKDAASQLAPEALYGLGLCELELRRPEPAIKAFRDLLTSWPEHSTAASATFYLAQTLAEQQALCRGRAAADRVRHEVSQKQARPRRAVPARVDAAGDGRARRGCRRAQAFIAAYPGHPQAAAARRKPPRRSPRPARPPSKERAYSQLMQQPSATAESLYDAGVIAGKAGQVQDQQVAWGRLRKEYPNHPLAYQAAYDLAETAFKKKEWTRGGRAGQGGRRRVTTRASAPARSCSRASRSSSSAASRRPRSRSRQSAHVKNVEAGDRYRALAGLGLAQRAARRDSCRPRGLRRGRQQEPRRETARLGAGPGGGGQGAAAPSRPRVARRSRDAPAFSAS